MNQPKTALVTGANKGIGFEVARQLAHKNIRVFLGARDAGRAQDAADRLRADGVEVVEFLHLDISDPASIERAGDELERKTGALDILVNNAGILEDEPGETILDMDPALLLATLETNTFGPLRVTQRLASLLAAAPDGARVINLSSGLGQLHDMEASFPAYSISKTALNAVSRQLAAAFQKKGQKVAVNSVCPGWVRTDMGGKDAARSLEEGADTVLWLAAEAPLDITGQFLRDRKPIPW